MPRPLAELVLSDDERQTLTTWVSRPTGTQRLATRARIVLACAEGLENKQVATKLRVCSATVSTWRRRFVERRLEGLADEPRPGAPRKITDAAVERVVTRTLESKPRAATHWSIRGLAAEVGLSPSTVGRILKIQFGARSEQRDGGATSHAVQGTGRAPRQGPHLVRPRPAHRGPTGVIDARRRGRRHDHAYQ